MEGGRMIAEKKEERKKGERTKAERKREKIRPVENSGRKRRFSLD